MRRAVLVAAVVAPLVVTGCGTDDHSGSQRPQTPRTSPSAVRTHQLTPDRATFAPLTPARNAADLAQRITVAERALHDPHATESELRGAGFQAQLGYRQLARTPAWEPEALRRLPARYRPAARLQVAARRSLRSVLTTLSDHVPAWRVQEPAPLPRLIGFYKAAQRRYGVPWRLLAAVNFVESAFGKVHGLSTAGAQGPMQFMPSTWAAYGSGDVDDPHDAILGAAHYLAANGAATGESGIRRALLAYNNAPGYVEGILDYRAIIEQSPAALRGLYHWQVVYLSSIGDLWLPIGYARRTPEPASAYAATYPSRHLTTATD